MIDIKISIKLFGVASKKIEMNEMWEGGVWGVARSLMDCVVRT